LGITPVAETPEEDFAEPPIYRGSFGPCRRLVAFAGPHPSAPPHDLIEGGEIRAILPIREESRCLEG
jgi:hypothetical protein